MFNRDEWSVALRRAYGIRSEKIEGIWMFSLRKGLEMNIVGDFVSLPRKAFFEKASGVIRVDSDPGDLLLPSVALASAPNRALRPHSQARVCWERKVENETYRLTVKKPLRLLLKEDVHQKTRNLINKAVRAGVETELARDEGGLWIYYKMYVRTMVRIGAIPQSYRLFKEMWRAFGQGTVKVFLSRRGGKVVSGIVALQDGDRLHIWSNASRKAARAVSANMATYAAVLEYACEEPDINEVDFGNTKPGSSLAFFKSRFGASAVPIWTVASERIEESQVPAWPAKILSMLPVQCVSMIAHVLFRFIR
ncbi:GNAT family N-acetyltransferase [Patescibacteria group bacterium]|nr:GNAT family N-acetyltransferase [Patescibacteria group bacterium]